MYTHIHIYAQNCEITSDLCVYLRENILVREHTKPYILHPKPHKTPYYPLGNTPTTLPIGSRGYPRATIYKTHTHAHTNTHTD